MVLVRSMSNVGLRISRTKSQKLSVDFCQVDSYALVKLSPSSAMFHSAVSYLDAPDNTVGSTLEIHELFLGALSDNIVVVASFLIVGVATLIAHKSVEQLRFWGVPSMYIEGMKVLHAFIWLMGALAMAWLCTVATIKFCRKVGRELL